MNARNLQALAATVGVMVLAGLHVIDGDAVIAFLVGLGMVSPLAGRSQPQQ